MDKPTTSRGQMRLGSILLELGIITQEQLDLALEQAHHEQRLLGQVLVSLGYATEESIDKAVSVRLGIPYFTTFDGMLDLDASKLIPETAARKLLIAPIMKTEDTLMIGMVNPSDTDAIDEAARLSGLHVQPVMTTLANLFETIQICYGGVKTSAAVPLPSPMGAPVPVKAAAEGTAGGDSIIDTINGLLHEGLGRRASDVHIEAAEKVVRVRFRIDGMLVDSKNFPKTMEAALVARVKILAKLDITETRMPQDGHIRFVYGGRGIDVRVSTLPTVHGEKVVMRLLDSTKSLRKLTDLGIEPIILSRFTDAIKCPNGLILVTGPTGSGKTTTLYAALTELNRPDRNIVTLEDPVEYVIDRINQMETFSKIGLTFASGLRAILRQDPNIILVGEIRDLETAEIALQSSITGHVVFSTLHTNDAASSVHRLFNMRVEPFMITAALRGVLAQRLMRRLCDKCKKRQTLTARQLKEYGLTAAEGAAFFEPAGCGACFNTGYSGRLPIHEWLPVNRQVRELIIQKASVDDLRAAMTADGMRSMRQVAMEKAATGETTIEEMLRLTREQVEA
ncbi:MAG: Flp pilus assembly complex ATPase component TadA [Elusimicrobia bacterium]|nr:Flp pilus assembly complex ATPase component TadA [Elusimicrobiota bacterium]